MRKTLALVVLISLFSCKEILKETIDSTTQSSSESLSSRNFKQIKGDSLFTLSIPKYMKAMNSLNPEALLQYANIYKEVYTIVIVENKEDFVTTFKDYGEYDKDLALIENYTEAQINLIREAANVISVNKYGLEKINDINARQIKLILATEGVKAGYIIGFFEGKKNIYMIMNWTLLERMSKYENTLEMINDSFTLLND